MRNRLHLFIKQIVWVPIAFFAFSVSVLQAQDKGTLSGDLQLMGKFYQPDSARGAINTPFYDYLFYGADGFLSLHYRISGFDFGLRFDMFHNSSTLDPNKETNGQAIGRWFVSKKIDRLSITGGFIYDQYGSGTVFRAYENRSLGIDQSLLGVSAMYALNDNWRVKAFTGKMKRQLDPELSTVRLYHSVLKGANIDGLVKINDKIQILPGASLVSRTIDNSTMSSIVSEINSYAVEERFVPSYSNYAGQLYSSFQFPHLVWYVEGAYKQNDVLRDAEGKLFEPKEGYIAYSTLTYSQKGFGVVVQGKYTKNFDFRTSPNQTRNNGMINYLPALTRQNSGRLTARYNPATQALGELAFSGDLTYSPKKTLSFNLSAADVQNLDTTRLFRELYADVELKPKGKKWKATFGLQAVDYNQQVYEQKGDWVNTLTPFAEMVFKFDKKKSLKTEFSYMLTKRDYRLFGKTDPHPDKLQDFGDWVWLMAEFDLAPHWAFSIADMYGIDKKLHFPLFFVAYNIKSSRIALAYTKQPAGVICTGGICRLEPAFSGIRLDLTSSF